MDNRSLAVISRYFHAFFYALFIFININWPTLLFSATAPSSVIYPMKVRLLNFNAFMMPSPFSLLQGNKLRLKELASAIQPYDIIGLTEVTPRMVKNRLIKQLATTHPFHLYLNNHTRRWYQYDGGLLLLSRFPLTAVATTLYKNYHGGDQAFPKGILFAQVELNQKLKIEVALTHLQAHHSHGDLLARKRQLGELKDFLSIHHLPQYALFLMGDLNIPANEQSEYNYLSSMVFPAQDLYSLLNPQDQEGYTYDGIRNPLSWGSKRGRIDYIWYREAFPTSTVMSVTQMKIERFPLKNPHGRFQYLSDHFGLATELTFISDVDRISTHDNGEE